MSRDILLKGGRVVDPGRTIDQVMDQSLRNAIPFQWLNKEENVKKYVEKMMED